jgi:hypothetical protein
MNNAESIIYQVKYLLLTAPHAPAQNPTSKQQKIRNKKL